jgi:hypothetical protein
LEKVNVIERIRDKFLENGNTIEIPLLKGQKTFQAVLNEDGISVSNLASQPFLPWSAGLPIDSVEGRIAFKVYGKQLGQTVFRRITPIACILEWAGICMNQRGKVVLINYR